MHEYVVICVWFSVGNRAKFSRLHAILATPGLLRDYKAVTSLLEKQNVTSEKPIFKVLFQ